MTSKIKNWVMVTDCHRGVVYGVLEKFDDKKKVAILSEARLLYSWGQVDGGLFALANEGPPINSKISPPVQKLTMTDVAKVITCKAKSRKNWKAAKWGR